MTRRLPLFSMMMVLALFSIASAKSPKRLLDQSKKAYYDSIMVDYLTSRINVDDFDKIDKNKVIEATYMAVSGKSGFSRWCAANVFSPTEIYKYGSIEVRVFIAFIVNEKGEMYSPTMYENKPQDVNIILPMVY